jgi:hypothetical protein
MVVMYMTPPDNLVLMLMIIGDKKWVVSWCLVLLLGIVDWYLSRSNYQFSIEIRNFISITFLDLNNTNQ